MLEHAPGARGITTPCLCKDSRGIKARLQLIAAAPPMIPVRAPAAQDVLRDR